MGWTLVTGSAIRLGREIVIELSKRGHSVIIHYNTSEQEAEQLKAELAALGREVAIVQGDISSPEGVEQFIQRIRNEFGPIHYLVNNVGHYLIASGMNTTPADWQDLFQTNVFAPAELIRAFAPSLRAVVNIGNSGLNTIHAETYSTAYLLSKHSLLLLTQSFAKELAPKGVRVNMISPGILNISVEKSERHDLIPMGRTGLSEEVARVVAFALDEENAYMTGQNIEITGGYRL